MKRKNLGIIYQYQCSYCSEWFLPTRTDNTKCSRCQVGIYQKRKLSLPDKQLRRNLSGLNK